MEFCGSHRAAYEKFAEKAPFKLPQGWAWTNLRAVCSIISKGTTPKGGCNAYCESGILFIRAENICSDGKLSVDNAKFIQQATHCKELSRSILKHGDLLVTIAGSLGRSAVVSDEVLPANTNQAVSFARPFDAQLSHFLQMAILSMPIQKMLLSQQKVTGIPNLTLESISDLPIPLPPLAEQKRIVSRIDELFKVADSLGETADGLETTAKHLNKKILDLAIRGKLVPQDPNDEPASELLKRIATTSHKSPCKNHETPIEPPFAIPESWEWAKLGEIISLLSGRDLSPSDYSSFVNQFPYITGASNFVDGRLVVNRWTDKAITISHNGDLLITCKGTIGAMAINNIGDIHIARQIMAISSSGMDLKFIKIFLESAISTLKDSATSMIPGIDRNTVLNLLIPVPPLSEQKRIVTRVQEARDILALLFP